MNKNVFVFFALLLFTFASLKAQEIRSRKDSLPNENGKKILNDSINTHKLKEDSLKAKSDIDTLVSAEAKDSTVNNIAAKTTTFYGKAKIIFKDYKIEADVIELDWNKSSLRAYNRKIENDTAKKSLPTLTERNESYKGSEVLYNFKTKIGVVKYGETSIDDGFYKGNTIKKISNECYYIKDGIYTTCNEDHPHFYFYSPKMKVIPKSVIIAEPIYLYIADVPVFAIPFAVLPNKSGRQSGVIPPSYGDDINRGKNFRHLGYFWDINDYSDINLTTDIYMKGGYSFSSLARYNIRYLMNGSVNLSYSRQKFSVDADPAKDWRLELVHNQNINPTTDLNVNFSFMSNSYFTNNSTQINDILQQNIVSNATFHKSWEGTNRSLTINVYRDQNLTNGDVSENLPSLSFSQSQIYPFKKDNSIDPAWYEDIGFNYNNQLLYTHTKTQIDEDTIKYYKHDYKSGMNHNLSFNFSPKMGHFNLTPTLGYNEIWYDKIISRQNFIKKDSTDSIVTTNKSGFYAARTYNLGLSLGTRFYGIFQPNVWGINSIRHSVMPSISYNYTPDFSKESFGYYDSYKTAKGQVVKYSKFEDGVFGGPSTGESQNLSFNVGNIFEMKTISNDSLEKENKFQLLNLNAGISYNMAADSMRLSDLNVNYRTNIAGIFDLYANTTYSFYNYDKNGYAINQFLNKTGPALRLTNVGFNISASFKGEKSKDNSKKDEKEERPKDIDRNYYGIYDNNEINFDIPWNLSLSYDYNFNKTNPYQSSKSSNLRASLGFNLTEKWRFDFSSYYDMVGNKLLAPQLRIQRDLHCWMMNFSCVPTGKYAMFNFEIRIKAPQLSDIKINKQGSTRGVFD
jgi:lipopolysaccharide assembly outer membrane protein LptD (OstA)